jgi:hypothetical protein
MLLADDGDARRQRGEARHEELFARAIEVGHEVAPALLIGVRARSMPREHERRRLLRDDLRDACDLDDVTL